MTTVFMYEGAKGQVSRFLTAHQQSTKLYSAIQVGSRWKMQDKNKLNTIRNSKQHKIQQNKTTLV